MKYLYESIPARSGDPVQHFEIPQNQHDEPLTCHPESGVPIRRVILGGWGGAKQKKGALVLPSDAGPDSGCCGPSGCC